METADSGDLNQQHPIYPALFSTDYVGVCSKFFTIPNERHEKPVELYKVWSWRFASLNRRERSYKLVSA